MGIEKFEIVEDQFSINKTTQYKLSILLGMDSLVYIISQSPHNILLLGNAPYLAYQKITGNVDFPEAWEAILSSNPILKQSYQRTTIEVSAPLFTLVPERLFNDRDKRALLEHLSHLGQERTIGTDLLPHMNIRNVYSMPEEVTTLLQNHFPESAFFELNTSLIIALSSFLDEAEKRLFCYVTDRAIRLYYFEGPYIIFANSFDYYSPEDFLYYILLVYHHFNLSPENQRLSFFGAIDEESESHLLMAKYIRYVEFLSLPKFITLGKQLRAMPQHFYFDVCSLLTINVS